MSERVFVDDWQMQCCGEPFSLGSTVTWTVFVRDVPSSPGDPIADVDPPVTAFEDHHDCAPNPVESMTGRVTAIGAVFCKYEQVESGSNGYMMVPGTVIIQPRTDADGWEEDEGDGLRFYGYVVDLTDTTRRPVPTGRSAGLRRLLRR
jgi:hypothetical protein